jgi:hypothetical protein
MNDYSNIDAMTGEQAVSWLRQLRLEHDEAGRRFMEAAYAIEQRPVLWQATGRTFPEFLEANNICKAVRYLGYKRVRENLGAEEIAGVGVEAVVAAGSLKSHEAQRDLIGQAKNFEKTNGTSISEQTARKMSQEAKIREASSSGRHAKGYLDLVRENEQLRADMAELRNERDSLAAELRIVKNELKQTKAAASKSKSKSKNGARAAA